VKAFAYLRVSTEKQTVETQKRAIQQWAKKNGVKIVKWFEDQISGTSSVLQRPGFKKLLEELQNGEKPDLIVVFEISRLARSFTELWRIISEVEEKHGVPIVSVSSAESVLNTLDPNYRQFVRSVLAFVAQMERELIRQRTKAAMEKFRKDVEEEDVKKIVELYKQGHGIYYISKQLGISQYLVRRALLKANITCVEEGICPRCFAKMQRRAVTYTPKGIKTVWYCPHCGYEEVK